MKKIYCLFNTQHSRKKGTSYNHVATQQFYFLQVQAHLKTSSQNSGEKIKV